MVKLAATHATMKQVRRPRFKTPPRDRSLELDDEMFMVGTSISCGERNFHEP